MAKKTFTLDDIIAAHRKQTGLNKTSGNSAAEGEGTLAPDSASTGAEDTGEDGGEGQAAKLPGTVAGDNGGWKPYDLDKISFKNTMNGVSKVLGETQRTLNRLERNAEKVRKPLDVGRIELGKNRKVEKKEKTGLNGEKQVTYVTESGDEYDNETMATLDQQAIDKEKAYKLDPIGTELKDALQERDELMNRLSQRSDELAKESDESFMGRVARAAENQFLMLGMGGTGNMRGKGTRLSDMADKEYRDLTTALNKNNDRILALKAQRDKAGTEFWRNFGDTFKRSGTWTFGFSDAIDALNLATAGDANGARENRAEQMMLEQTAKNEVAQSEYAKTRNWVGNGGIITANMIPFALEIAAGGGVFTKLGKAGANMMTRITGNAIKNKAGQWTLKTLGKLGGYYAGSAVVANTTGLGGTLANIGERYAGEVELKKDENGDYVRDENGRLVYEQKKGDLAKSIYQGEVSSIREFFTEKALEPLMLGKGITKGMEKIGLKKITEGLNAFGNVPFVKTMRSWMKRAGLSNYPEEGMEEELGIIMGSIDGTGDNKISDLWDKDQQLDIWGGMAFSMGALGAVQLGAGAHGYMKYSSRLKKADKMAEWEVSDWENVRDALDSADNDKILGVVRGYLESDMTKESKHAVMRYANALMQFRGFNNASEGVKEDEVERGEGRKANTDSAIDAAYMQGFVADEESMKDIRARYEVTRQKLQEMLGGDVDIDNDIIADRTAFDVIEDMETRTDEEGNAMFSEEERVSMLDYMKAKSAWDGLTDGIRSNIESAQTEAWMQINSKTNTDDNMVWAAKTKTDKDVYIIQGRVELKEDGSIDLDLSDDTIIVRDSETGKQSMVDIDSLMEVSAPVNSDELFKETQDKVGKELNAKYSSLINGSVIAEPGRSYDLIDADGGVSRATIMQQDENGNYIVKFDGGDKTYVATKEQLQQSYDEANAMRLQESIKERRMSIALRNAKAKAGQGGLAPDSASTGAEGYSGLSGNSGDGREGIDGGEGYREYSYGDVVDVVINGQQVKGTVNAVNDDGRIEVVVSDEEGGNERIVSLTQEELAANTASTGAENGEGNEGNEGNAQNARIIRNAQKEMTDGENGNGSNADGGNTNGGNANGENG
ncbi:MAG: hypothetical protein ACI4T5_06600, partial [Prevotella sp.]